MGVPVLGSYCEEIPIPGFLIHLVIFISYILRAVDWVLHAVGVGILLGDDFHGPVPSFLVPSDHEQSPLPCHQAARPFFTSFMIRQALPSSPYQAPPSNAGEQDSDPCAALESCMVCLHELEAGQEVRRMGGCCHVYHTCCIDSWVDTGRPTCPLCRAPVVPDEMMREAMIAAGKMVSGEYVPEEFHGSQEADYFSSTVLPGDAADASSLAAVS